MKKMTIEQLTAWFEDYDQPVYMYGNNYHLEHKGLYFTLSEEEAEGGKFRQTITDTNIDCDETEMKAVLISIGSINGMEEKEAH